ncbi:MAG: hypothetical protein ACK5CA_12615 [Cyanobacteriota bacterium]|jgi:hypothetical protein
MNLPVRNGSDSSDLDFRGIELFFANPLTGTPGETIALELFTSVFRGNGTPTLTSVLIDSSNLGSVTATPVPLESDALPIVGAAAFMAGGLWFKRHRAQAKANLDFLSVESEK